VEAWASLKNFQRKHGKPTVPPDDPGNATVDFHGEKRSNQTHESKTDPNAKLARKGKGKEANLSYNGNLLVENRTWPRIWSDPVGAPQTLVRRSKRDMPSATHPAAARLLRAYLASYQLALWKQENLLVPGAFSLR
jgi:hypothetical protein